MKIKSVVIYSVLFAMLAVTPVYLIVLGVAEFAHRRDFERIEREFYVSDELHELQLRLILTSYEDQYSEQIGRLHQNYLDDGSFALLDEVEQAQSQRIEELIRLCPTGYAPRLAACMRRYELRERASYMAQIPFVFRSIPRGMIKYMLRTDPK